MNELSFSSNHIDQMAIRQISSNAGVFSGENRMVSWTAKNKQNQGSGSLAGDHIFSTSGVNMVDDRDIIDAPSNHTSEWILLPKKE